MNALAAKILGLLFVVGSIIGAFTWQANTIKTQASTIKKLRVESGAFFNIAVAHRVALTKSEDARDAERTQCAEAFAGEDARHKIEVDAALKAGSAIARVSQVCTPLTPAEKTKLYRDIWGAHPK